MWQIRGVSFGVLIWISLSRVCTSCSVVLQIESLNSLSSPNSLKIVILINLSFLSCIKLTILFH